MASIKTVNFLPTIFRSAPNRKFLNATLDQLVSEPSFKKLNGYVGRRFAPTFKPTDNYLSEPTAQRQEYQLEPSTVVTDADKNISFFSSYTDLIQQIEYYGGVTNDHSRLFNNEYYSFNGQVDFDKLVNFNQYYWIPNGPAAVDVFSGALDNEKAYFVTRNVATQSYNFTGHADAPNPDIFLSRGGVYTFSLNQPGSPFWIQTDPGIDGTRRGQSNISTRAVYGVENNGSESGVVTFRVPQVDAQDEYVNMPTVAAVDMATALPFNAIDNQLLEVVVNQFGGIDGVTSNLAGKYLAFVSDSLSDAEWEELGVYAYLGYGNDPYDHGSLIPDSERLGVWQIQLEDSTEGDQIVRLVYAQDIGVGEKIFVKSGDKYANREYYKAVDGLLYEVPLITATMTELFYNDGTDQSFYGRIRIVSDVSYSIDVQADILGKTQYISPNGVVFTNGLKVLFDSQTVPSSYANREYYVEGVGTGIRLVAIDQLATPELDIGVSSVPFDIYSYDADKFDQILNGPLTADYITINRASIDGNAWSRSNRWFHVDVVNATAAYNNTLVTFDGMTRAQRPIIEFNPDLQLFNNGRVAHKMIDILDFSVADAMSTVEGQTDYYIGTAKVEDGMRILFAGDTDPIIRDRIYIANVLDINGVDRIHLTQADDVHVSINDTIVARSGTNKGVTYWYNGSTWTKSQQKTAVNQAPLFDIVDYTGASYATYDHSSFVGCKVFSYKEGTGAADKVLGFPLSYRNFNSVGDIQFSNDFDTDVVKYQVNKVAQSKDINSGFLQKIANNASVTFKNVWTTNKELSKQYQVFTNVFTDSNNFYIDVLPTSTSTIPYIKVYVNSRMLATSEYSIVTIGARTAVQVNNLTFNDVVDILIYSENVSQTGYYEIPSNLNYNALNADFSTLTLGQFRNHLVAVASNSSEIIGAVPGQSNFRDLDVLDNGGCILQHSAPAVYSSLFLLDKEANFIDSITYASHEYTKFKHKFLEQFPRVVDANITSAREGVDFILKGLNIVKNKSMPWFYSDMVPYDENKTIIDYTVLNVEIKEYEIDKVFDDTTLSNNAALVYLNGVQLTKGIDYEFSKTRPAIKFIKELNYDDVISIHIYHDTDGNYIPETPTKVGLYPKYTPALYLDSTYLTPINVIRGHDGSIMPAFGDFRDDLLLELERRIYNNIKVTYDPKTFDINSSVPGKFRDTEYNKAEFDQVLTRSFLSWVSNNRLDYSTNEWFNANNPWTWVYSGFRDPLENELLPGGWRGIYRYFYDTDAPNERPWEMLGFSEAPSWWVDTYGPAPYTGGNMVLWGDLEAGHIAAGDRAGIDKYYARPGLSKMIPVDDAGNLRSPEQFAVQEFSSLQANGTFVIGDEGPVEAAWRRSSDYPFAIQRAIALTEPGLYFGRLAAVHNYRRNETLNQYVTGDNFRRITPADFVVNGLATDNETINRNAGYLNWIADYLTSMGINPAVKLRGYLDNLSLRLGYKAAGFTDKSYLKVLAEQSSPGSVNESIVIPDENYTVHLHKSAPVDRIVYSAVIIEKTDVGYSVTGYNTSSPFFTIIPSEPNSNKYTVTAAGVSATVYNDYQQVKVTVPYGYNFRTKQQLVDFLISYGRFLQSQGFVFDTFNPFLQAQQDWELSAREFLSWSQQGWSVGSILVVSPTMNEIKVVTNGSVVDEINNLPAGSKVLDVNFQVIKGSSFNAVRERDQFSINAAPEITIGLVDLSLVQYEHALVFDNETVFNDVIYKPELGNRQFRLKLIGNKTSEWTGQVAPPGFVYSAPTISAWQSSTDYRKGELVSYKDRYYVALQNVAASDTFILGYWKQIEKSSINTGLLPNFAYNAKKFEYMYDVDSQLQDQNINMYSTGLTGFRERSFLTDLGVNTTSQSKFYQGYIRDKGTKESINALANATFSNLTGNIEFLEEWALRVGEYGATEANQYVEIQLDDATFNKDPLAFTLLRSGEVPETADIVGVYQETLYKRPAIFNDSIFTNRNANSNYDNDIQTAGYVNLADVDATLFDITDYTTLNASLDKIVVGYKVWVAKDYKRDWNVYRIVESPLHVTEVDYALDSLITMTFDTAHNLADGEVFVVKGFSDLVNGFYKVVRSDDAYSVVVGITAAAEKQFVATPSVTGQGVVYRFHSLRVAELPNIVDFTPDRGWKEQDSVWVDADSTNSKWAVYNKELPWSYSADLVTESALSHYGQAVAISPDGGIVVASTPGSRENNVRLFVKTDLGVFVESRTADIPHVASTVVGNSLAMNQDTIAVSVETTDATQSKVNLYSLSGAQIVDYASVTDQIGITVSQAILESAGYGYFAKPVVAVSNRNIVLDNGTIVVDPGYGLNVEVLGHFVTGSNSGVSTVVLTDAGAGYTTDDNIIASVTGADGTGAIVTVQTEVVLGSTSPVTDLVLTNAGTGYTTQPTVIIAGDATADIIGANVAEVRAPVASVTLTNAGTGYTAKPAATIVGDGTGAMVDIVGESVPEALSKVTELVLVTAGSGYTSKPTVTFTGGEGAGATAEVTGTTVGGSIMSASIVYPGTGYTSKPTVTVYGDATTPAVLEVVGSTVGSEYVVSGITIVNAGAGYTVPPTVVIAGGGQPMASLAYDQATVGTGGQIGNAGTITVTPTWNAYVNTTTQPTGPLYAFGDTFISTGDMLHTSPNGVSWAARPLKDPSGRQLTIGNIVQVGNKVYALAHQRSYSYNSPPLTDFSTYLVSSTDGATWTIDKTNIIPVPYVQAAGTETETTSSLMLAHNGAKFAVVQTLTNVSTLTTQYIVQTSSNGITWTSRGTVIGGKIVANGSTFIVSNTQNSTATSNALPIQTSVDGITWANHSVTAPVGTYAGYSWSTIEVVAGRIFVPVSGSTYQNDGTIYQSTQTHWLIHSTDAVTWNTVQVASGYSDENYVTKLASYSNYTHKQIAYAAGEWKMLGITNSSNGQYSTQSGFEGNVVTQLVKSSTNLTTWASTTLPDTNGWTTIAAIGPKVAILGDGFTRSSLYTSASVTNYTVSGSSSASVTTSITTVPTSLSYVVDSNSYTTFNALAECVTAVSPATFTITGISLTYAGNDYRSAPTVAITGGSGTGATAIAKVNYVPAHYRIDGITLTNPGGDYLLQPTVQIVGNGTGATATATVNSTIAHYRIDGITLTNTGSGYTAAPTVEIVGDGTGATAIAKVTLPVNVTGVSIAAPGAGYTGDPVVTISKAEADPTGLTVAKATAGVVVVRPFVITGARIVNPGQNYVVPPLLTVVPEDGVTGTGAEIALDYRKSGYGSKIAISKDNQWLFVAAGTASKVCCYNNVDGEWMLVDTIAGQAAADFGYSISTNDDGSVLVIGAPKLFSTVTYAGGVFVYIRSGNTFNLQQHITPPTPLSDATFGYSVCLAGNDSELFVGEPGATLSGYQKGMVYRYKNTVDTITGAAQFALTQEIRKPFADVNERFGTNLAFDVITSSLLISSKGANTRAATEVDSSEFILDSGSTVFIDNVVNSGAVYAFELLKGVTTDKYSFSQQLTLGGAAFGDNFGNAITISHGHAIVGSPMSDVNGTDAGKVQHFMNDGRSSWAKIREEQDKVDLDNISRIFTYNAKTQVTTSYLDYIDPAKGKLLGIAEQEIAYKTSFDPANYNTGTNADVAIDPSYHWNSKQVGRVWWNLAKVRYVDYEQGDLAYRIANWGRVFPGSTIEVAEWVESDVKPSLYKGVGTPLHADDSAYVVDAYVDPVTGIVTSRYFFWVVNSNEVPLNAGRSISLVTLKSAIAAPTQQGIPYAAVVRNDTMALFSSANLIDADRTILHIDYSLLDTPGMIHNEYELVQEGAANMSIPPRILNKLIDSLAGTDTAGNIVPDINLKLAERYGIGLRPRQTMVVNRLKAVENLVSYVNKVLLATPIVGNYNLNQLYSADAPPTTGWDIKVATLEERSYINTLPLPAGTRVLVESDADYSNQWVIYELTELKEYVLVQTQVYDTTDYWTYATWYAADYDPTQKPTYTVEFEKDVAKYPVQAGDVVKIKNKGAGTFAIHRYTSATTYDIVGIEAGTIQLKKSLYSQDTDEIGFDNDSFDTIKFDLNPTIEFRQIMYALRDDIFTQDLRDEVSNLFFIMLNYILSEQRTVDWAFKTSFVSVIHKLRKLEQFPNFIKDNQTYYEDYINEVKPYRTKIREYVADYQGNDEATIEATDFDLPSYYDTDFGMWRSPSGEHARDDVLLATVPAYAAWANNYTLGLDSIVVQAAGTQYTHDPVINIVGGGGTGATAVAVIDFYTGGLVKVLVTNRGTGYTSTPTVEILGDGIGARAYAMMSNPNTRQFDSVMKFDRVTYESAITPWAAATTYAAGTQVVYDGKVYSVNQDLTTPTYFQAEYFTEVAAGELASAADRVAAYYAPTTGMLPKDMRQLFTGVEYPGVNVEGPQFDAGPGFDVPTFDFSPYDNFEFNSDGTVQISADQIDTIIASQYLDLALGTRPEDIDIVGGGYVDVYNSHAPEELLPGMMYDTLDIQVYTVDPVTPEYNKLGYRISKSMLDETKTTEAWEFRRIAEASITTLAEDLLITDTVIYVTEAAKLPVPGRTQGNPGVIYINGEKIIYWQIDYDTNTITQFRRGTWGTGAPAVHKAGSKVTDASAVQKMPGNADTHVWLNAGFGTIVDGQGLHKSTTDQALFLFAGQTLLPWMPGEYEWVDPNLNHFKWDMGAFDMDVGFDSYDQG